MDMGILTVNLMYTTQLCLMVLVGVRTICVQGIERMWISCTQLRNNLNLPYPVLNCFVVQKS